MVFSNVIESNSVVRTAYFFIRKILHFGACISGRPGHNLEVSVKKIPQTKSQVQTSSCNQNLIFSSDTISVNSEIMHRNP